MEQQILQLSESDLLLFLGQSTTTKASENAPEEAKQQQNSADFFNLNLPFGTIGNGNRNGKDDIDWLKGKIRYLEGKVDSMELKAKVKENNDKTKHEITIANNEALAKMVGDFKDELREEYQQKMNELKDEFAEMLSKQNEEHQKQMEKKNQACAKKSKKAEKTAEMAKNEVKLEEVIQANQLKNAELTKEIALLTEQEQQSKLAIAKVIVTFKDELREQFVEMLSKQNESQEDLSAQIDVLKEKNKSFGKKVKKVEENAQMAKNQLEEKVEAIQQKMAELAKEMALLKEQQQKTQIVRWVQDKNKERKVENPKGNCMKGIDLVAPPSLADGCTTSSWRRIYAKKGFPICRSDPSLTIVQWDPFPNGTIVYYYEVTQMSSSSKDAFNVGLSDRNEPTSPWGVYAVAQNRYAIRNGCDSCHISKHTFLWPEGATKPECNGHGDVYGCGLLFGTKEELAIFFTLNGILLGQPIPISPGVGLLYPIVIMGRTVSLEANFGEDAAKPFAYDIAECPGMVFE